jgi:hypothetical protein
LRYFRKGVGQKEQGLEKITRQSHGKRGAKTIRPSAVYGEHGLLLPPSLS